MHIICSAQFSGVVKKAFETMLEGSERGMIIITPNYMELKSVDSLSVCMCSFKFLKLKFCKYDVSTDISMRIDIRPLYLYLKKKTVGSIHFSEHLKQVFMYVVSKVNRKQLQHNIPDDRYRFQTTLDKTRYFLIPPQVITEWAAFSINTEEFSNIILDLSTGGGYIDIVFCKDYVQLKTEFETGRVSIKVYDKDVRNFDIIKAPSQSISNRYLTKFFKQTCIFAPICINMVVYTNQNAPIVMIFDIGVKGLCKFSMVITPVITT